MPELNNEFQIPRAEATSFEDGDQLDFHTTTSKRASVGDSPDSVKTSQVLLEVPSSPEFGVREAMRLDEKLEWIRATYSDENWNLKD